MDIALLDILECPFCGGSLELERHRFDHRGDAKVETGILSCECCAYPIVSGIPYIRTGAAAENAMRFLGEGRKEEALLALFEADSARREEFAHLVQDETGTTFRRALGLLSRDGEATYLLYRFSDPTFLAAQAVLEALGQDRRLWSRRVLEVGSGTGHLSRTLARLADPRGVLLADVTFWKLWLATRFVAPDCDAVCCDANVSLPFAADAFSLVFCSDAFHYVWARRLLAAEMRRLAHATGAIVLAHLHNRLAETCSTGMPLSPEGYRKLFGILDVRLFPETSVLEGALERRGLDLSRECSAAELRDEANLLLVATRLDGVFRVYDAPAVTRAPGALAINPLYRVERVGPMHRLVLQFPSPYYESEYSDCKRYLPEALELAPDQLAAMRAGVLDSALQRLAQRHVLLELPERYL